MAKIDRIKEILTTLRLILSISMGILVIVIGSVIHRLDNNNIDDIFWISLGVVVSNIILVIFITKLISKKTNEIGDL